MNLRSLKTGVAVGAVASAAILGAYFGILTLVSGWSFALDQFALLWYFIAALALGFGIQAGLYAYLRSTLRAANASGATLAVTGTTSTVAMISCCAHSLVNILPVLGATGIATLAAAYQVELFWVGIALNLAGIAFMIRRIRTYHEKN